MSTALQRDSTLAPGDELGGFRIVARLGQGSVGTVYRAEQLSLSRPVALKILDPRFATQPRTMERFLREARSAARLIHANIVQVHEMGEDRGLHYIALEFVDGLSIASILDDQGPLAPRRALDYARQAALALGCAHEAGIVHRDIKPANLLVNGRDELKVADFGLAHASGPGEHSITHQGAVIGTPNYMSPEQAQGLPATAQSDIYSLGATFYHMLTGRPPFAGEGMVEVLEKHVSETPETPEQVNRAIPAPFGRLVMDMLAKSPDARPRGADAVLRAMAEVKRHWVRLEMAGPIPIASPPTPVSPLGVARPAAPQPDETEHLRHYRRVPTNLVARIEPKTVPADKRRAIIARIRNLSRGGVFIETNDPPPVDTIVEIRFRTAPGVPAVRVIGVVRRIGALDGRAGMGVQFVQVSGDQETRLAPALDDPDPYQALARVTRTPLHRSLLQSYYGAIGDSVSAGALASRLGAIQADLSDALDDFAGLGLAVVRMSLVTFLPPEDPRFRKVLETWISRAHRRREVQRSRFKVQSL